MANEKSRITSREWVQVIAGLGLYGGWAIPILEAKAFTTATVSSGAGIFVLSLVIFLAAIRRGVR